MKLFLLVLSASLFACGDKTEDTALIDDTALAEGFAIGEELYTADCAVCHGTDGTGASGPNILNEDVIEISLAIQFGHGSMPAFPAYTDQDIADVTTYIGTL